MGGYIRRCALRLISITLTALYRAYRLHPAVWRLMARNYRPWMGRFAALHAWMTCQHAALKVPAYTAHLAANGWRFRWFRTAAYPPTDKESYVRAYPQDERCWHGRPEIVGSVVDESSGASGTPYNWVRGRRELDTVHRNVAGYTSLVFPSRRLFVLNAYSMGAWATGTNTGIAMARIATVKNTGPGLDKIVDTLRHFGPAEDWFLKSRDRWRLAAMVGGEGMTEALRDYVGDVFGKVRSGYGASDLTIGMGGETTFSVWLRRLIRTDEGARAALLVGEAPTPGSARIRTRSTRTRPSHSTSGGSPTRTCGSTTAPGGASPNNCPCCARCSTRPSPDCRTTPRYPRNNSPHKPTD